MAIASQAVRVRRGERLTRLCGKMPGMEQAIPRSDRRYTEEEYLRLEEASPVKHEFRGGRIIAMAGGTHGHAIVAMNLGGELRARLRGTPCITAGSDVRVRVAATGDYLYPDLTVVYDEPVYVPPNRPTVLANPQVIVEVLSASTTSVDFGEKLDAYRSVATVREYVLLAQDRPWARSFYRDVGGPWGIGPWVEGLDGSLVFRSLGVAVPLAEVYDKVRFPPAEGDLPTPPN